MTELPADPAGLLAVLGVQSTQVVAPTYGYDGAFTPKACLAHWTASAAGSDTASSVVAGRHYHACTSRSGVVQLGGWKVRQGHGGEGRTSPQSVARQGGMTVAELDYWHGCNDSDDTSSGANQDFYGVCIDNDGVGERPADVQWHAFTASLAVFVAMTGGTHAGYLCDHAASTNRKVDLISMTAPLFDAVTAHIATLLHGPPQGSEPPRMWEYLRDESARTYAVDGMTIRWLPTPWADAHYRDLLDDIGEPTTPRDVSQKSIINGEWGVPIGTIPD